jgi:hypothetical protein
MTKEINIFIEK